MDIPHQKKETLFTLNIHTGKRTNILNEWYCWIKFLCMIKALKTTAAICVEVCTFLSVTWVTGLLWSYRSERLRQLAGSNRSWETWRECVGGNTRGAAALGKRSPSGCKKASTISLFPVKNLLLSLRWNLTAGSFYRRAKHDLTFIQDRNVSKKSKRKIESNVLPDMLIKLLF